VANQDANIKIIPIFRALPAEADENNERKHMPDEASCLISF
jgi:hypothetical protein